MSTTAPQIVLRHANGSDDWEVTLDCGSKLKLRTHELTSYQRFRMLAAMQAARIFPLMSDQEWNAVLGEAMRVAEIDVALLACAKAR